MSKGSVVRAGGIVLRRSGGMAQEANSRDPGSVPSHVTSFDVPEFESSCLLSGP